MTDKKISALTAASTPLAGTEVLPIVQSGSTVKVAVSDLTAGRNVSTGAITASAVSGAIAGTLTGGVNTSDNTQLRFAGKNSGVDLIAVGTNISTNGTGANFDIFNLVSSANLYRFDSTGNLTPGVAAKGVNFTANTPAAGMTSQLLNWYEEGTFTATLKGSTTDPTTPVTASGRYTRIGRAVTIQLSFEAVDTTGAAGNISVTGLPYANTGAARAIFAIASYSTATWTGNLFGMVNAGGSAIDLLAMDSATNWTSATHNAGTSRYLSISGTYTV